MPVKKLCDSYPGATSKLKETADGRALLAAISCLEDEVERLREAATIGLEQAVQRLDVATRRLEVEEVAGGDDYTRGILSIVKDLDRIQAAMDADS